MDAQTQTSIPGNKASTSENYAEGEPAQTQTQITQLCFLVEYNHSYRSHNRSDSWLPFPPWHVTRPPKSLFWRSHRTCRASCADRRDTRSESSSQWIGFGYHWLSGRMFFVSLCVLHRAHWYGQRFPHLAYLALGGADRRRIWLGSRYPF